MATVRLKNLRIRTILGCMGWERELKQDIILNITVDYDASLPAETDNINDALNYKELKLRVIDFVESSNCHLIENLCMKVLKLIHDDKKVKFARVEIDKPSALRFVDSVSVEMTTDEIV
ncbi:MAG: FolB domain-containing protein [Candidatus Delongbacteria bacterium]|nr:FolB domain-containing protein [Candidatus Delongbacteria bacterium]MBN2836055.1 FolB domain-containing protein [Candidatus Delongbacteria bacterium]